NTARFAPAAKIAHVDIDPTSIGRNLRVDIPVVGDLGLVLEDLAPLLRSKASHEWLETVEGFRRFARGFENRLEGAVGDFEGGAARLPTPRAMLSVVNELLPDAVVATEVGQNQMWAAQYLAFNRPRRWLTSGGLGTMGYGFPAGMGAQAALPDKTIVVIAGDGSFQMNIQELATCVQEGLPLIVVVMNNGYLGMVRQWQELFFERRYSAVCLQARRGCDLSCGKECAAVEKYCPPYSPDFAAIARAYGALGYSAATLEEFRNALSDAIDARRPAVIDCAIGREENVWPIVAPGKGNDEMMYKGVSV
ncbi:MAG: thiamine pyrophosphate-dependent enzyme, partial [Rectinemataceae bacterium]|nr:thiamine pyrophosphate-dependent enzyme [Rectinemataceae bacterium]